MGQGTWTNEQWKAINERNGDILVAAAAGSGKTAVLVERIISLITEGENPLDIDRLLVVTFTKAAAGEMCERIGDAIIKKLNEDPENAHLQKQLVYINRADIKTIDSFFLRVVKENYNVVGIDPAVRTADNGEVELLKAEVMNDLFEELYESEDNEGFLSLVESYGGGTRDTGLRDIILKMYTFLQSNPYPEKWANDILNDFDIPENGNIDDTKWGRLVAENIKFEVSGILDDLKGALDLINSPNGPESYKKVLETEYNAMFDFYNSIDGSFSSCYNGYKNVSFASRIGVYKGDYKDIAEMVKTLRNEAKDSFKNLGEKYFKVDPNFSVSTISKMSPIIKELVRVTLLFSKKYSDEKRERMIMDFNDYGHYCIKILLEEGSTIENPIPSKIALEYQEKYDEILIDEYQDSNFIQEMVLSAISKKSRGENNRFLVGDVKQSIYRFRLAKPEIFMEKYETFDIECKGKEKRIDLFKNFRSRENVLYSTNFLFRQLMTKDFGDIVYDDRASLYAGAVFPETDGNVGGSTELHIIEKKSYENISDELLEYSDAEIEALFVAKRIKELIESGYMVFDKKTKEYRKVQYRDITVLLRSKKNWTDAFSDIFESQFIPSYAEATAGYFDTVEIETILDFLKLIDNPLQDIPLIATLRSPIFRFTGDELVDIKIGGKADNFFQCALNYSEYEHKNEDIEKRLSEFFRIINEFRDMAEYTSVSEIIREIYVKTGYFDYVGGTYGGNIKQANLRLLIDKAKEYENSSFKGLFHFVRYIERVRKNDIESGEASITGENDNIVKIMSIHKSKGLEFPVVFVAGMGKTFNKADIRDSLLLHQDLGIGGDYIDYENRAKYSNITKVVMAEKIDRENLSEELRVLYVAMTRAKEKLIMVGSLSNIQKKCTGYITDTLGASETLSPYKMLKGNNYLDWVIPALVRHRQGEKIYNITGTENVSFNDKLYNDESCWDIYFHEKNEVLDMTLVEEVGSENDFDINSIDISKDYSGYKEVIHSRMNWVYPNINATILPSNISISEMKRNAYESEYLQNSIFSTDDDFEIPSFSKENTISAKNRGTVIHTVMEKLDFSKEYKAEDIDIFVHSLFENGTLSEEEANSVKGYPFITFFNSEIGKRVRNSDRVFKEKPFVLGLTPFQVFGKEEYKNIDEKMMVHGIIDCYFYEGDDIVLIDYKSDNATVDELKRRYTIQLELYKKALESITGHKVKDTIIYSFKNGCEIYL
ncbi:MAG: helicase-exonuclease AddAB subunit AddA [Tyzzerella sp.]|uniref:ATP-dependent helicase/nuclease subunit A n=1 Tax=Candidatus Fimicola merdigallinarum TaxID=2840819 RepID=A0A9D9H4N9_9FIRM|nr:helicase-exonuclease AddAB subunit AddA [Candidatus Fimicola merdigallinarum]